MPQQLSKQQITKLWEILKVSDGDAFFGNSLYHFFKSQNAPISYCMENAQCYQWSGKYWKKLLEDEVKSIIVKCSIHILDTYIDFPAPSQTYDSMSIDELRNNLAYANEILLQYESTNDKSAVKTVNECINQIKNRIIELEAVHGRNDLAPIASAEYLLYQSAINKIIKLKLRLERVEFITSIYKRLQIIPEAQIHSNIWNRDPLLINVSNGVLNIDTHELTQHEPSQYFDTIIDVKYDPDANCEFFNGCINQWFQGSDYAAVRKYVQEIMGYTMSGFIAAKNCFFLYSKLPDTGKSTFIKIFKTFYDQYASKVSQEFFMLKSGGQNRSALPSLDGVRFLVSDELTSGQRFDEGFLKCMTGGDQQSTRILYKQHNYTFEPVCKILFHGNSFSRLSSEDEALWRRMRVIPFDFAITEEIKNQIGGGYNTTIFHDKVKAEYSGILNWLLDGFEMYKENKLSKIPQLIKEKTDEYRNENDELADWLADNIEINHNVRSTISVLWADYSNWCIHKNMVDYMRQRYFEKKIYNRFSKPIRIKENGISQQFVRGLAIKNPHVSIKTTNLTRVINAEGII
jgi:P4 family phage/plasmid primase-like protien